MVFVFFQKNLNFMVFSFFQKKISVNCKYDENLLLTRLLDGYRLEFFKSTDCPLSEELGRTLFEMDPLNVQAVPDSCVRYVQGLKNFRFFPFFCEKLRSEANSLFFALLRKIAKQNDFRKIFKKNLVFASLSLRIFFRKKKFAFAIFEALIRHVQP